MKTAARLFDRFLPGLIWASFAAACLALSACGTIAPPAPATQAEAPLNAHDATAARALALQKIGESAKDAETQRLAIFAIMQIGSGGGSAPAAGNAPQAHTLGDVALGLVDRVLSGAERVAGPLLAYRGQIRAAETTERVAGINRDVSLNQSNNFLALGAAGINGTSATGIAGLNALAGVASRPQTPTTNVTGNTGPILIGGGNLNSGSLNPVNPAPIVCGTSTATGVTCSR